ncbi:MAG: NAD(P)H-hydrate dehydratase, partial [Ignavibacteria bacterium]|nr:NAD(P)H-hydrate dehydratase [Ignavibacteria bacterium]
FNGNVVFIGDEEKLTNDAKINFEILNNMSKAVNLKIHWTAKVASLKSIKNFDLIIDAMLGTGLSSELREPYLNFVKWSNKQKTLKLAVDVPTGLFSDDGKVGNDCFNADFTLTMGLPKVGLLINEGPKFSGEVHTVDISFPNELSISNEIKCNLIEAEDVAKFLPTRPYDAHKYSVGKVLAITGSKGLTGAAIMSAESALISGCGGVLLACTEKLQSIYAKRLKEVMYFSVGSDSDYFIESDYKKLKPKIEWADVLMIGPGLGQNIETEKFLLKVLKNHTNKKKVIDADGLNLLARILNSNKVNLQNSIITPHLGEFSRLTNMSTDEIKSNFLKYGNEFAQKHKCIVVLKGAPTITFSASGESYINSTGNPGMATVGMGDVLTGLISGLYAQGISSLEAAVSGVFIHGLAGDIAANKKNEFNLISGDVIKEIPNAYNFILNLAKV